MNHSKFIDFQKLKSSHQTIIIALDIVMVALIVFNLSWILFDTFYASAIFRNLVASVSPEFEAFYTSKIHPDFVAYDLIFVSIFVTELLVRWAVAIYNKTYHKWFFYPFVHWYDVLGCIPIGSFRWLRLLRVISILYRLQKYEVIDLSKTYPVRFAKKYFNVLVEEVSDRVVLNVLDGVQNEIKTGNPVVEKVMREVLMPQKQVIIQWLTQKVNEITESAYPPNRAQLKSYVDDVIADSISKDLKVAALEKVPFLGGSAVDLLETTVSDVVFSVLDRLVEDVGHEDTDIIIQELADIVIDQLMQPSKELNLASREVLIQSIDVIKDEVRVQKWKINEERL